MSDEPTYHYVNGTKVYVDRVVSDARAVGQTDLAWTEHKILSVGSESRPGSLKLVVRIEKPAVSDQAQRIRLLLDLLNRIERCRIMHHEFMGTGSECFPSCLRCAVSRALLET